MAVSLVLAASGRFAVGEVMLGGALIMVVSRILTMDQAYRAVDFKSVVLVAGMLPTAVVTAGLLAALTLVLARLSS